MSSSSSNNHTPKTSKKQQRINQSYDDQDEFLLDDCQGYQRLKSPQTNFNNFNQQQQQRQQHQQQRQHQQHQQQHQENNSFHKQTQHLWSSQQQHNITNLQRTTTYYSPCTQQNIIQREKQRITRIQEQTRKILEQVNDNENDDEMNQPVIGSSNTTTFENHLSPQRQKNKLSPPPTQQQSKSKYSTKKDNNYNPLLINQNNINNKRRQTSKQIFQRLSQKAIDVNSFVSQDNNLFRSEERLEKMEIENVDVDVDVDVDVSGNGNEQQQSQQPQQQPQEQQIFSALLKEKEKRITNNNSHNTSHNSYTSSDDLTKQIQKSLQRKKRLTMDINGLVNMLNTCQQVQKNSKKDRQMRKKRITLDLQELTNMLDIGGGGGGGLGIGNKSKGKGNGNGNGNGNGKQKFQIIQENKRYSQSLPKMQHSNDGYDDVDNNKTPQPQSQPQILDQSQVIYQDAQQQDIITPLKPNGYHRYSQDMKINPQHNPHNPQLFKNKMKENSHESIKRSIRKNHQQGIQLTTDAIKMSKQVFEYYFEEIQERIREQQDKYQVLFNKTQECRGQYKKIIEQIKKQWQLPSSHYQQQQQHHQHPLKQKKSTTITSSTTFNPNPNTLQIIQQQIQKQKQIIIKQLQQYNIQMNSNKLQDSLECIQALEKQYQIKIHAYQKNSYHKKTHLKQRYDVEGEGEGERGGSQGAEEDVQESQTMGFYGEFSFNDCGVLFRLKRLDGQAVPIVKLMSLVKQTSNGPLHSMKFDQQSKMAIFTHFINRKIKCCSNMIDFIDQMSQYVDALERMEKNLQFMSHQYDLKQIEVNSMLDKLTFRYELIDVRGGEQFSNNNNNNNNDNNNDNDIDNKTEQQLQQLQQQQQRKPFRLSSIVGWSFSFTVMLPDLCLGSCCVSIYDNLKKRHVNIPSHLNENSSAEGLRRKGESKEEAKKFEEDNPLLYSMKYLTKEHISDIDIIKDIQRDLEWTKIHKLR